jgi:glycosyltransferase involved in cell wall biosynthesis
MNVMRGFTLISVITPIHSTNHKLPEIRNAVSSATTPTQLIIVLDNPELATQITPQTSNEQVLISPRKGRGFAFLHGIANTTGDITLLLHSDTIPPPGWDQAIIAALKDPLVIGGGFSMAYDTLKPYLTLVIWAVNQIFRISGELYGDRGIFLRSKILRHCMPQLEVPLFEDVRLVQCMHKHGRVVLLKEKAETSADAFRQQGFIQYIAKYLLSRVWYALGGSPFQIYQVYYQK